MVVTYEGTQLEMLVLSQLFLRSSSFLTKANAHCAQPRGKMEQSLGKGI